MSDAKENARTLREADGFDADRAVLEFIRQSYRGDGSPGELSQTRALWRTYRRLLPDDQQEPPTALQKKFKR